MTTKREVVRRVLEGRKPPYVPWSFGFTLEARQKLSAPEQRQPASSSQAFFQAQSEWARENPFPPATADTATRTAYFKKQLQFLDEWRAKLPGLFPLVTVRFSALAAIPDTTDEVLVHEGFQVMAEMRKTPGGAGSRRCSPVCPTKPSCAPSCAGFSAGSKKRA